MSYLSRHDSEAGPRSGGSTRNPRRTCSQRSYELRRRPKASTTGVGLEQALLRFSNRAPGALLASLTAPAWGARAGVVAEAGRCRGRGWQGELSSLLGL